MISPETKNPEELNRQAQCRYRRAGSCDLINMRLGWKHGMPLPTCNTCWELGAETEEAAAYRESVAAMYLNFVKNNADKAGASILKVLKRDHLTAAEFEKLLENPEVRWSISREERWSKVRASWEMAESFANAMGSRGWDDKRVDLTIKGIRHTSCFGTGPDGQKVKEACPALKVSKDKVHHWCGECGCGDTKRAWMDKENYSKLDYPHLECPRAMPGFSNEGEILPPSPFDSNPTPSSTSP